MICLPLVILGLENLQLYVCGTVLIPTIFVCLSVCMYVWKWVSGREGSREGERGKE